MSYDITLCAKRPDQDWEDALEAANTEDAHVQADPEALAAGVETFRRIEARLREVLDGELETWVAEETGGDVYGEATVPTTGVQVELFDRSASVSYPYWEHDDLDAFHAQVRAAVQVVAEETGYRAYDPQTGQDFDGTFDDGQGREAVRDLGVPEAAPADGEGTHHGLARPSPDEIGRRDPVNLRRRGWIYLVLGLVIVALAIPRLREGDTGALTIILLVIGLLDLLGGAFLLAISRRQTPGEQPPA